jgi:hypothetical protein
VTPCPTCGQPMPEQMRRDAPLPPRDHPAVVTIHDLPAGTEVEIQPGSVVRASSFTLRTARDVVDGREGGR